MEPSNVKALYRRGQAHAALRSFQSAASDLQAAAKSAPEDAAISVCGQLSLWLSTGWHSFRCVISLLVVQEKLKEVLDELRVLGQSPPKEEDSWPASQPSSAETTTAAAMIKVKGPWHCGIRSQHCQKPRCRGQGSCAVSMLCQA